MCVFKLLAFPLGHSLEVAQSEQQAMWVTYSRPVCWRSSIRTAEGACLHRGFLTSPEVAQKLWRPGGTVSHLQALCFLER